MIIQIALQFTRRRFAWSASGRWLTKPHQRVCHVYITALYNLHIHKHQMLDYSLLLRLPIYLDPLAIRLLDQAKSFLTYPPYVLLHLTFSLPPVTSTFLRTDTIVITHLLLHSTSSAANSFNQINNSYFIHSFILIFARHSLPTCHITHPRY